MLGAWASPKNCFVSARPRDGSTMGPIAVEHLASLVAGLAAQVDDMVAHIERRNQIATAILGTLEPRE